MEVCSEDERVCVPRKREGSDEGCSDLISHESQASGGSEGLSHNRAVHRFVSIQNIAPAALDASRRLLASLGRIDHPLSCAFLSQRTFGKHQKPIIVHFLTSNHSNCCHVTELIDVFRVASSFRYMVGSIGVAL